mmetsp:Transcript_4745/g.11480  ORF Transcript_4745/g.11480 Transcript_4745/m.11480 type:complete len:223 (+) Transcript_4745:125-793(+)
MVNTVYEPGRWPRSRQHEESAEVWSDEEVPTEPSPALGYLEPVSCNDTAELELERQQYLEDVATRSSSSRRRSLRLGSPVILHIYDLHNVTRLVGLPIYHLGVEVYGREFYYSVEGICTCQPAAHKVHVHKTSVALGWTERTSSQINNIVKKMMMEDWQRGSYNILTNNCQSFALAFLRTLCLEEAVPDKYTQFSNVGERWKGSGSASILGYMRSVGSSSAQ